MQQVIIVSATARELSMPQSDTNTCEPAALELPADTLLRAARGVDRKLVTEIRLFDVYEGAGLAEGKKSLAITVVLQPLERTLIDAEIEGFSKRLIAQVCSGRIGRRRPAARVISPGIPLFHGENSKKRLFRPFAGPNATSQIFDLIRDFHEYRYAIKQRNFFGHQAN